MKVLMKGNEALAEAAIRAGCHHFFGYPITPPVSYTHLDVYKRQTISSCWISTAITTTCTPPSWKAEYPKQHAASLFPGWPFFCLALCDGFHACRFVEELQALVSGCLLYTSAPRTSHRSTAAPAGPGWPCPPAATPPR